MAEGINLALVGATTLAGEGILAVLEQSALRPSELFLVDSDEGAGERIRHRGKEYLVQPLAEFDFSQADVAIFIGEPVLSASYARKAASDGSYVIDASGHFRGDTAVPLVLPQINPEALESASDDGLVALPSAVSSSLLTVLKPLHDAYGVKQASVTAMLAVSEMGKAGVDELSSQAVSLFNMREVKSTVFPQQVVFNAVPQVGAIDSSGNTLNEQAMIDECLSLLGDKGVRLGATLVWLPVFFGHSLALHLQLGSEVELAEVELLLSKNPAIAVQQAPSAVAVAANSDKLFVGRLRQSGHDSTLLQLWIVADNLRFGIARGAIELAQILEKSYV